MRTALEILILIAAPGGEVVDQRPQDVVSELKADGQQVISRPELLRRFVARGESGIVCSGEAGAEQARASRTTDSRAASPRDLGLLAQRR
jgi:hypothetical protein